MKKIAVSLFLIFLLSTISYADKVKYVFLFIGDGMSASSESALSLFLYGKTKNLFWNNFPIQTYMATWSRDSYIGKYNKDNFDENNGYNSKVAGTVPYPYYRNDEAEEYFNKSFATDSAAAATAMATGVKVYNGTVCYDKENKKNIPNIVDKINEKKEYNVALITTDKFYSATPAGFSSHNIYRENYKQIASEILLQTKPEIIVGRNKYEEINTLAKLQGYYYLEPSDITEPQVFGLINKKIFLNLKKYYVPQPIENFSTDSFEYRDYKFSDIVLFATKTLLQKNKPFFALVEVCDIDKANHKHVYTKMLGGMYELNETVKNIYDLINSKSTDMTFDNTLIIVTADHSTGMLRFKEKLHKGELPFTYTVKNKKTTMMANRQIVYKKDWHTNELVGCYCIGAKSDILKKYINENNIMDNTSIYKVLNEVLFNN